MYFYIQCITPPIEIGEKTPNNFVMLEKPEMDSQQITAMLWQYMCTVSFFILTNAVMHTGELHLL